MAHYRYILSADTIDTLVRNCQLLAGNAVGTLAIPNAFRISIPVDMTLQKWTFDLYSTTEDSRSLRELGAIPMVKIKGRWRHMPVLAEIPLDKWTEKMEELGYHNCYNCTIGYITTEEWNQHQKERFHHFMLR